MKHNKINEINPRVIKVTARRVFKSYDLGYGFETHLERYFWESGFVTMRNNREIVVLLIIHQIIRLS